MGRKWRRASAAILPFLAAVVACSNDDSGAGGDGLLILDATSVTAIPAGAPLLDQDNLAFIPGELSVSAGSPVYIKNSEAAAHTVTVEGRNVSGAMRKDDMLAWIPPSAGTYRITCDYHPQMRAMITVK